MLADKNIDGIVFISGIFGKHKSWDISQPISQAVDAVKNKPVSAACMENITMHRQS
ncbi:MAG: hypothetical protein SWO11_21670 [Thermodesulfobacteriota bacterium]|nr:hypothetical protein [Thermodesulfobacteriota bacterium]